MIDYCYLGFPYAASRPNVVTNIWLFRLDQWNVITHFSTKMIPFTLLKHFQIKALAKKALSAVSLKGSD
jgi:hypothetical protein